MVTILTDGSGPDRQSRLDSTRRVLDSIGCSAGSLYGAFTDREIYGLMREGPAAFVEMAGQLEKEWAGQGVTTVAGDGLEGFNSTHDVCRMIINAVVERGRRKGRMLENYTFALDRMVDAPAGAVVSVALNDQMFQWKGEIVRELYPEMAGEVARVIASHGEAPFRTEVMHAEPPGKESLLWNSAEPPFYETYGARQIQKGHYHELITYREHLLPIAERLWQWVCEEP